MEKESDNQQNINRRQMLEKLALFAVPVLTGGLLGFKLNPDKNTGTYYSHEPDQIATPESAEPAAGQKPASSVSIDNPATGKVDNTGEVNQPSSCEGSCYLGCTGCGAGCSNTCKSTCSGNCVYGCDGSCTGKCLGGCYGSCSGCTSCTGTCTGCTGRCTGCSGTCMGCTGTCQGTCGGSCYGWY